MPKPTAGTPVQGAKTHAVVPAVRVCGAKNKRGGICRTSKGLGPNGRCRMHNGFAAIGPASPNFKHGRHSKLLKDIKGLSAHYERALADPDLLRLDAEVALTDARISQLLAKVGQAKGKWAQQTVEGVWPQLDALIETRRKLVDTETKRMKDMHAMVSVDRVMTLVAYVSDSVKRHVTDKAALALIFADLRKLLRPTEGE